MGANKTLNMKKRFGRKIKQNRPLPNWYRYKSDTNIRYNSKRRNWRRTKLKIY
uniref:Large ribosomal subunit protein eL39 n=2 Tax=Tetrahymena thermophila (strain SB210) TaxID=312017 RepID=RL39_TETTS|nr:RecName: Full=Large ribosomal subunit protein eL39; AltName: Full=60S ribosomal protein L39 [Tetrahymena thermophila SB210]4V8P_AB Chain AB, RPL39 [Tetrahymena thermophila]4V8P_DB Chain DB, RPL39 [Tetrahymena thermophila]4V8P_FB Chain FB, RPL39 [Tetrahymena thermophila]4V8P_HB Chain HB, RPL39 [Tetrahymena thermophila]